MRAVCAGPCPSFLGRCKKGVSVREASLLRCPLLWLLAVCMRG